jgi:colanic acid/amylovoran biosynthesis glycosyltransferase
MGDSAAAGGRTEQPLRVAFVVPMFPLVSEPFIIDQIATLLQRGVDVDVYSFNRGDEAFVSHKFFDYDMARRARYMDYPLDKLARIVHALPRAARLAVTHPRVLLRALDVRRYGREALSLKLLYWSTALAGRDYDVVHCHFGYAARDFVWVREVTGIAGPMVTTFYGVDASRLFREQPPEYYDRLKNACSLYFVMSTNMKNRVVAQGFDADQVRVHPVGIEVDRYAFRERTLADGEHMRLLSVARFVEKKGLDDLLRAMAIVRDRAARPITCAIVGGGPLEDDLRRLHASLDLGGVVTFEGYKSVEEVIVSFDHAHALVQPSKTAADGDME